MHAARSTSAYAFPGRFARHANGRSTRLGQGLRNAGPADRRNVRRFGLARPRFDHCPEVAPAPPAPASDLRLFAHSFVAAFLFVTVFIA